ncbi:MULTISPECIES: PP2C family protein-serine/threonine phosphatase [unclassified Mesorhizobium]|uniref:PP2C family protein-serine/threonine phosphatase n=1 Tax=unclassified Mesorhizobium TaxID=325217 RepID=UPI0011265AE3|nr:MULTISPECIES: protein phosphatase 2C domain-containing protein [unclassified Mesorhizobium]MBZ9702901.1 protein phosphatase 2C domain-containing protein [Mesorhizobium sp. CO1-1-3]MBZ9949269.1 protein phosphatase 2C domain-containing protein [Mesorhizobium sp. BR1-1-11]MCA0055509.1 protein phosphatase 2C domain-containing protein [Mesorhizobium sp. B261B1A]TPJ02022.1 serine/threonine-protein phosphatase [Mesorhizobium sp. B2-8-1]TPL14638.1 serine/threonine-protein phosphatase [Mesorhizobium
MNNVALPIESFGVSHRGCVRELNEDNYLVEPQAGLWLVADGMGGHDAGEVASASIVNHLATIGIASSAPDLRARFEDRLSRANAEIRRISQSRGITIGSTFAALLAIDGRFACLWAGDSRVYLIREASISQISKDHTEVQELIDKGMLTEAEALTWPRRNVITQAVGVSDEIVIDFQQGEILPGDIFVLSTDGLTAHVTDAEIEAATVSATPQSACENLLETVLARGGTDNVTIVLVRVAGGYDSQSPRPAAYKARGRG